MTGMETQINPHMWIPNNGRSPEPFEEICALCGVLRYAVHKQRPEPNAAALPCPERWPDIEMSTEELAEREAQAEREDRANGKGALYDDRPKQRREKK